MLVVFLFIFSLGTYSQIAMAQPSALCQDVADHLQEGDLIFLDMDSVIFEQVAVATQTWTSHVGVAVYNEGWYVVESALLFSRETPLCKYLARTQDEKVEVRRLRSSLLQRQIDDLKVELSTHMDILYDTGFNYDSDRMFCSKLVYDVFKNALGVEVGAIKTMQQLFDENPNGSTTFWQFWFLGNIPWERRTVTPKDQLIDDDFTTVYQNGDLTF